MDENNEPGSSAIVRFAELAIEAVRTEGDSKALALWELALAAKREAEVLRAAAEQLHVRVTQLESASRAEPATSWVVMHSAGRGPLYVRDQPDGSCIWVRGGAASDSRSWVVCHSAKPVPRHELRHMGVVMCAPQSLAECLELGESLAKRKFVVGPANVEYEDQMALARRSGLAAAYAQSSQSPSGLMHAQEALPGGGHRALPRGSR